MREWNFGEYKLASEPSKRERAYAWMTAIGLQKVDGLDVSEYLLKTARRNIEGEISHDEAVTLVDKYYETKEGLCEGEDRREADMVAVRINRVVALPGFNLSPVYYLGLHKLIFGGVFSHAGKIRDVELSKKEWVLNGDSVSYTPSPMIHDTLEYEFDRERKCSCASLSDYDFITHISDFIAAVWQIHPFREGNTRTAAVFIIKYLQDKGYAVTNALFEGNSWYFRNALVRANYQNHQLGVQRTLVPLEEFFRVLLFDEAFELKNRYLHIDVESGKSSVTHKVTKGVTKVVTNEVTKGITNEVTDEDRELLDLLINNPRLNYEGLAASCSVSRKTIAKRIKRLKEIGVLIRVGSKTHGFWRLANSD